MKSTVLVVEDDMRLAKLIQEYLTKHEFMVSLESDGLAAVDKILRGGFDCVILDINLPSIDGLEVCRQIREHYLGPVLMLTARGTEADEVLGLETGADDYLAKPMQPRRLVARLNALLRRTRTTNYQQDQIQIGSLNIEVATRLVYVDGRALKLTASEFDLLYLIAQKPGQVCSRATLHEQLRDIPYDGLDRSIDLTIARIRKKLGDSARHPRFIQSIHGVGYKLAIDS